MAGPAARRSPARLADAARCKRRFFCALSTCSCWIIDWKLLLENTETWGAGLGVQCTPLQIQMALPGRSGVSALAFNLELRRVDLFTICLCRNAESNVFPTYLSVGLREA